MDGHAEQAVSMVGRVAARRGIALAALLLTLASGCVTPEQLAPDLVTSPTVTRVAAIWSNHLMPGVDPAHNGAPLYGIAGRIYLFGPGLGENLVADGKVVVEMRGVVPEQPQGVPVLLETWVIKKDILNGVCLRKDGFGTGYTLNLPWEHYRPDVTQLDILTRYEPAKGVTIYTRDPVTLAGGPGPETNVSKRVETGDRRVITASAPPAAPQTQLQPVTMPAPFVMPQQAGAVQPAVYPPPHPAATPPSRGPVPAQLTGAAAPPVPVAPPQPGIVLPPVYQPPQPAAAGAVQPAGFQMPGQAPYQPQAAGAFPGAWQR
jgi:hypothetical protein